MSLFADKQRWTKLPSDTRKGLATRAANRALGPRENYPAYDIAYTLSVFRYNNKQIRVLRKRIKHYEKKESKKAQRYVKVYSDLLDQITWCQEEIHRFMYT